MHIKKNYLLISALALSINISIPTNIFANELQATQELNQTTNTTKPVENLQNEDIESPLNNDITKDENLVNNDNLVSDENKETNENTATDEIGEQIPNEENQNTENKSEIDNMQEYMNMNKAIDLSSQIQQTSDFIINNIKNPSYGDEWKILGLARSGIKVPDNYFQTYYKNLEATVIQKKGNLHRSKYTEYSRVIITLTAIGKDPTNVGGYNLVEKLYDYKNVSKQGINGTIFALIALDTKNFSIPEGKNISREQLIQGIIDQQLPDGGFNLTNDKGDADITAMALQSLAKYKDKENVKLALDKAINFLSNIQLESGGYGTAEGETVESSCQVLVALNALGIDINDTRFVKNGKNVVDAIMRFKVDDGGFKHLYTDTNSNLMATEQALYSMVSQSRYENKKTRLYDMSDVIPMDNNTDSDNNNNSNNNQGGSNDGSNSNNNNSNNNQSNPNNTNLNQGNNGNSNSSNSSNIGSTNNNSNKQQVDSINNPKTSDSSILVHLGLFITSSCGLGILNKKSFM